MQYFKTKITMLIALAISATLLIGLSLPAFAADQKVANEIVSIATKEFNSKPGTKSIKKWGKESGSNCDDGCCSEFANYCARLALKKYGRKKECKKIKWSKEWKTDYKKYTSKTNFNKLKPGDILSAGHTMVVVGIQKNKKGKTTGITVIEGNPGNQYKQGTSYKKKGVLFKVAYPKKVIDRYPYTTRF